MTVSLLTGLIVVFVMLRILCGSVVSKISLSTVAYSVVLCCWFRFLCVWMFRTRSCVCMAGSSVCFSPSFFFSFPVSFVFFVCVSCIFLLLLITATRQYHIPQLTDKQDKIRSNTKHRNACASTMHGTTNLALKAYKAKEHGILFAGFCLGSSKVRKSTKKYDLA